MGDGMRLEYIECYCQYNECYNNICTLDYNCDNKFNIRNLENCFQCLEKNKHLKEKKYVFGIEFFIFDNLTSKGNEYLDKIFKDLDRDYLNDKLWKRYLSTIEKKEIDIGNYIMHTTNCHFFEKYYKKSRTMSLNEKLVKNAINNIQNIDIKPIKKKIAFVNTEIELLHAFLDLILLSNPSLIVKKCKNCNKYYITTSKSKVSYCDRKYGNTKYTCFTYLEQKIRNKLKDNEKEFSKFPEYRKKLKLECGTDLSKYVSTLIDTYYRTINGKRTVIKDTHLAQFLNKEYLEKISYKENE